MQDFFVIQANRLFGGSFVSLDSGILISAQILVVITVVGFIAGFVWRVSHIPRDRRQQGLDS